MGAPPYNLIIPKAISLVKQIKKQHGRTKRRSVMDWGKLELNFDGSQEEETSSDDDGFPMIIRQSTDIELDEDGNNIGQIARQSTDLALRAQALRAQAHAMEFDEEESEGKVPTDAHSKSTSRQ